MELTNSVTRLRGVGPKIATVFEKNGIQTVQDLLHFFPRAWMNATEVVPVAELRPGQSGLVKVQIASIREGMSQRTRLPYLRALGVDSSGSIELLWFHPRHLKGKVKPGVDLLLYGQRQGWRTGDSVMMTPKFITKPSIIPIYPSIGGLAPHQLRPVMAQLEPYVTLVTDYLPEHVCQERKLLTMAETIRAMHFPRSIAEINLARQRLAFDELLMIMVPALMAQRERSREQAIVMAGHEEKIESWKKDLPFVLTEDQERVIGEVLEDMKQAKPMNRLIQGDVGSGKTVIGLAAALQAIASGKQVVWLAPTELLAQQHFATAQKLLDIHLSDQGIGLLTRTNHLLAVRQEVTQAKNELILQQPLIIGTHALLTEKIDFANLGLLIIDEQHRFGVKQRAQLRSFHGKPIHLLSMTATPIPRTMALLIYGDLQLSVLKHKPIGRKPIVTRVVGERNRQNAYEFIDKHIEEGRQVYVVCPIIEPSSDSEGNVFNQLFETIEEKKAVTEHFKTISETFPKHRVAMLHGKLKANEKQAVMDAFRDGKIDILVSTTVIEVGVDVPNATIMIIESAERFGLAQLHQLRGRVGRGSEQSFCLLFPTSSNQADNTRLKTIEATEDGFILAEKDLELRGPGEITGLAQSGIPPLKFASLHDTILIQEIKTIATHLLDEPEFQASFQRFWQFHHPE